MPRIALNAMELAKLAWMQLLLAFHVNPMRVSSRTNANAMMASISMITQTNASHALITADTVATAHIQIVAQIVMNLRSSSMMVPALVEMDST